MQALLSGLTQVLLNLVGQAAGLEGALAEAQAEHEQLLADGTALAGMFVGLGVGVLCKNIPLPGCLLHGKVLCCGSAYTCPCLNPLHAGACVHMCVLQSL